MVLCGFQIEHDSRPPLCCHLNMKRLRLFCLTIVVPPWLVFLSPNTEGGKKSKSRMPNISWMPIRHKKTNSKIKGEMLHHNEGKFFNHQRGS